MLFTFRRQALKRLIFGVILHLRWIKGAFGTIAAGRPRGTAGQQLDASQPEQGNNLTAG
jgi:hypothetical protein